jgi:hypothetical protein
VNSAEKVAKFVARLVDLTNQDKLDWTEDFFNHTCNYKGSKISVSWLSGDRPSISINRSAIEGSGYGFEGLIGSIYQYYQRQKKGRYSPERQKEIRKSEELARQKAKDHLNKTATEIDKFKEKK